MINKASGAPINVAAVIAEGKTYRSNALGFVNIGSWLPGTFIASVEHRDYFNVSDTFFVLGDTTILSHDTSSCLVNTSNDSGAVIRKETSHCRS